ncbi:MAG TPA: DUF86 domain-containing protein [Anaerolineae bacterium]
MVDIEVVRNRLSALNEYVARLDAKRSWSLSQMLADEDAYYAIQHLLQLASQAAIDIATHILAADFSTHADNYRDVILALGSEGVLPLVFAQRFAAIAGFRNILIHAYLAVDPQKVHLFLQTGLEDFRSFARHIAKYLKEAK